MRRLSGQDQAAGGEAPGKKRRDRPGIRSGLQIKAADHRRGDAVGRFHEGLRSGLVQPAGVGTGKQPHHGCLAARQGMTVNTVPD